MPCSCTVCSRSIAFASGPLWAYTTRKCIQGGVGRVLGVFVGRGDGACGRYPTGLIGPQTLHA